MKIALKEEMETLLIPLFGRAQMSRKGILTDPYAEAAVSRIEYDFSRLRIQDKTQVMLSLRSAQMDAFCTEFLSAHPDSTVLHLGCGLDARARRLPHPSNVWYDLDYPQVIDIKRQLYPEAASCRYIPSSVTDWGWMAQVESAQQPVLVLAEGLLMYLNEQEVQTLFLKMRDTFREVTFVFDAYSVLTARQAKHHPSLRKTGAAIQWGVDAPQTMLSYGDGISHVRTLYLTDTDTLPGLPVGYRWMFKLAGHFKAAREAHRIFVMTLTSQEA